MSSSRRLQLSIDTTDRQLAFDMMGNRSLKGASVVWLPADATLTYRHTVDGKAAETIELLLAFANGKVSGVVVNWSYEKLKGRQVTLRIEEQEVEIEEGEIKRVISRIIEKSE